MHLKKVMTLPSRWMAMVSMIPKEIDREFRSSSWVNFLAKLQRDDIKNQE